MSSSTKHRSTSATLASRASFSDSPVSSRKIGSALAPAALANFRGQEAEIQLRPLG